jgi:serine/threonine protein phosphatase 1
MEVIGDYAFVHAGVHPDRALSEQRSSDLRWIRNPFLDHRTPLEKMIVHGHTVSSTVEFLPHRIGVDTGAYESGRLSALGLEAERTWHLDTI